MGDFWRAELTCPRDSSTHAVTSESCWSGSGGGISAIETYTTSFTGGNMGPSANYSTRSTERATAPSPIFPSTRRTSFGVYMLSQYNGGWFIVGGNQRLFACAGGHPQPRQQQTEFSLIRMRLPATMRISRTRRAISSTRSWGNTMTWCTTSTTSRPAQRSRGGSSGYDLCTGVGTPPQREGRDPPTRELTASKSMSRFGGTSLVSRFDHSLCGAALRLIDTARHAQGFDPNDEKQYGFCYTW